MAAKKQNETRASHAETTTAIGPLKTGRKILGDQQNQNGGCTVLERASPCTAGNNSFGSLQETNSRRKSNGNMK